MSTVEEDIGNNEGTVMRVAITFSIVKCDCGDERQAGTICPSCGRGADEEDPLVVARRAVAASPALRLPTAATSPLEAEEVFGLLKLWLDRFMATFEAVAQPLEEETDEETQKALGEELRGPISELDQFSQRSRVHAASAARTPFLAHRRPNARSAP